MTITGNNEKYERQEREASALMRRYWYEHGSGLFGIPYPSDKPTLKPKPQIMPNGDPLS